MARITGAAAHETKTEMTRHSVAAWNPSLFRFLSIWLSEWQRSRSGGDQSIADFQRQCCRLPEGLFRLSCPDLQRPKHDFVNVQYS